MNQTDQPTSSSGSSAPKKPVDVRDALVRSIFSVPAVAPRITAKATPARLFDRSTANTPAAAPTVTTYSAVKSQLHSQLLDEINRENLLGASEERLRTYIKSFVARTLGTADLPLNDGERKRLADDLMEETLGIGPLASVLSDPSVTDILVNGPSTVYVERYGKLEKSSVQFRDSDHLTRIIQRIASSIGRRIDESSPMVDARLADGSRINATLPPVSIDGPTLSIRRFGATRLRRDDLVRLGMFTAEMGQFLAAAVLARKNIVVSGGTGAGKSTLLGAIAEAIPSHERVITIEDAAELSLDQDHVVRMETRPANSEGNGRIAARDLLINSLRMRPDRIVMGEVRGGEALDMLQAMNTGHDGSLTTIHANSARDAISRLETMVLMAGIDLPSRAIREQIASAIQLIVQVRRFEDGVRRLDAITEVTGLEGLTMRTQDIFKFERRARKGKAVLGEHVATGVVPRMFDDMRERGLDLPVSVFSPSRGGGNG